MIRLPRRALVLLLIAILSTTAVLAAPGPGTQPRRSVIASSPIDLVSQLWSFLARLWTKNGSEMDPDGAQTKNGSQMGPSGNKLQTPVPPPPTQDNGHQVDPDG